MISSWWRPCYDWPIRGWAPGSPSLSLSLSFSLSPRHLVGWRAGGRAGGWVVNTDENGFKEKYHNEAGRKRDGDKSTRKGGA